MTIQARTVSSLGEGERDGLWQYDDPIWPAHYAWHPDEGWVYCTQSMPEWRATAAGHADVTTATITHGACGERFDFIELGRWRAGGAVLFTPRGPIALPDEMGKQWESKQLT